MTENINEGAARVLELGRRKRGRPFEAGTAEEARADYDASFPTLQGEKSEVQGIEERTITGPGGAIPLRIYRGIGAPVSGGRALLYLHGGGWVVGNLESHDEICRWFANAAGCTVVCPHYRLAPEHKFPSGLEDCVATLAFMAESAASLGIDPQRIAVAGDSAGGNLASVLALLSRSGGPRLAAQLLIYPNTDASQGADSYRRYGEGFGLTAATMRWFRDHYIRSADDIADWRVSPLLAKSTSGAPPAFIAIAGLDILADEGEAYAERLRQDGVPVILKHWSKQIHGFVSMGRHIPAAHQAVDAAVQAWNNFEA